MNFFRKPEVTTLAEWLEIATSKLTAPATQRIKAEIEGHYAESVAAHRENGLSGTEAERAALEEFGDAKSSAKSFRKHHLTQAEASKIEWSNTAGRKRSTLLLGYFVFAVFAFDQGNFLGWPQPGNALARCSCPFIFLAVEFLMLIALPTICFVLLVFDKKRPHPRWIVLMMSISGCGEGMVVNWLFAPSFNPIIHWLALLLGMPLLANFLLSFRIWWKLGHRGTLHSDLPPLDTTAAE